MWDGGPPTCLQLSSCENETKTEALAGGLTPPTAPASTWACVHSGRAEMLAAGL